MENPSSLSSLSTYNAFASRKFLFAVGLSAASVGLLATKRLDANSWVSLNKFVFSTYVLGNVGQKTFKMNLSNSSS